MLKIAFVCAGGISTSFLEQNTATAFEKAGVDAEIIARSASNLDEIVQGMDVVLLAPQVSYMKEELVEICEQNNILFAEIPFTVYGRMDGDGVLKLVLDLVEGQK